MNRRDISLLVSFTQHVLKLHSEKSKLAEKLQQRLRSLVSRLCLHAICGGYSIESWSLYVIMTLYVILSVLTEPNTQSL